MTADVHHLDNGVFVGEVHISDAAAPGCMRGNTGIPGHYYLTFCISLDGQFSKFLILLLFHCQFGGDFHRKRRHGFGEFFQYHLDVAVDKHIYHRWDIVIVFLADSVKIGIHYRYLHLIAGLLLNKPDNRCAFGCRGETIGRDVVVVADTLTGIATDKENITHLVFKPCQLHFCQCL